MIDIAKIKERNLPNIVSVGGDFVLVLQTNPNDLLR